MPDPVELFISYSHKDEALKEQLEDHLALLKRNGLIKVWHDRRITAGKEWAGQIDQHLNTAQVILLLVSAKFLASDYCYDKELTRALERHEAGAARVIPVILRPVDWELAPFRKLQALPTDGRPVTTWEDSDEAFTVIAKQLRKAIEQLSSEAPAPKPDRAPATPPRSPEQTPFFTGREEVLTGLRKAMESSAKAALSGIGGVGKTQTALEYVHRYRGQYNHILWTKADSRESLITGFSSLAGQLGLPAAKEQ
ncbi:MAG: toll/interleukin-1 receptor domain-containing protein, partial [bacterium]|nr:toll/interleukin-1 receptor domain-containing protein [bacterium]